MTTKSPECLAMLVCDAVLRCPSTGKHTLYGLFQSIHAGEFPCRWPRVDVYFVLRGGQGELPGVIELIDEDMNVVGGNRAEATGNWPDPLVITQNAVSFVNLTFDRPGQYRIRLTVGDTVVERTLEVLEKEPG